MESNPTPAHHPPARILVDDSREASRILHAEWHECLTCGAYVRNDDTETVCDPAEVKRYRAYVKRETQRRTIEARMEARRRRFNAAQARDEEALYRLRTAR